MRFLPERITIGKMPLTRRQAAEQRAVAVTLTLDDTARRLTRTSGSLHSISNFIRDTISSRRGFAKVFELSGSRSSANARALWRFHDRRWENKRNDAGDSAPAADNDEESDEEEDETIDEEIDRRIGTPFTFERAVEVAIECLESARQTLRDRKAEMEAWADEEGAHFLDSFIEKYKNEIERWQAIGGRLAQCTTTLGESFLDSSLLHGWV